MNLRDHSPEAFRLFILPFFRDAVDVRIARRKSFSRSDCIESLYGCQHRDAKSFEICIEKLEIRILALVAKIGELAKMLTTKAESCEIVVASELNRSVPRQNLDQAEQRLTIEILIVHKRRNRWGQCDLFIPAISMLAKFYRCELRPLWVLMVVRTHVRVAVKAEWNAVVVTVGAALRLLHDMMKLDFETAVKMAETTVAAARYEGLGLYVSRKAHSVTCLPKGIGSSE